MTVVNTNVNVIRCGATVGSTQARYKLGYIASGDKATQNDTWTVKNISQLIGVASATLDATGASEPFTVSGKVITLTGVTGTACSALIVYI